MKPGAIELVPIGLPALRRLAASESIEFGGMRIPDGALPPAFVAARAIAQLDLGVPAFWCAPFLIVSPARQLVLGGCGFKTAPAGGRVEISYGIARSERGRGVATEAIGCLVRMATASGLAREVVAHVLPGNAASSRLVARLGFVVGEAFVDTDGDTVVPWVKRIAPDAVP